MSDGSLDGRHALVTGASGFVGANLCRALLKRGCGVTAVVRESSDRARLHPLGAAITVIASDLTAPSSLAALPARATSDLVFHAAAEGVRPGQAAADVLASNIRTTFNLLTLLAERGSCARLVFLSSCSVYGSGAGMTEDAPLVGTGAYAESKIAGEALCASYSRTGLVPSVVLRLYTPYGPWEAGYRFVAGTVRRALRGEVMPLTAGAQTRDFVYIDDATEAICAAGAVDGLDGIALNVCTGVATSIRSGVQTIVDTVGRASRPEFGVLPYRPDEIWEMSGDPSRMRARLGLPAPVAFADGVARTVEWMAEHQAFYEQPDR